MDYRRPDPKSEAPEYSARSYWAYVITGSLLLVLWATSVFASFPATVITADWHSKDIIRSAVPQSWQFFTRSPQSQSLILFEPNPTEENEYMRADSLPQTLAENAWGLSRNQRAHDTEKAVYSHGVKHWIDCESMENGACLKAAERQSFETVNAVPRGGSFCGKYRLALTSPVKFAFRSDEAPPFRINKIAAVEVKC